MGIEGHGIAGNDNGREVVQWCLAIGWKGRGLRKGGLGVHANARIVDEATALDLDHGIVLPSVVDGGVGNACGAQFLDGSEPGAKGSESVVLAGDGVEGVKQYERIAGRGKVGPDGILKEAKKEDQPDGKNYQEIAIEEV
jgi:hypothetical protein